MNSDKGSIHRIALAFLFSTIAVGLLSCAREQRSLNLLVWEGYADPSFVHGFEEKYHCKVTAAYMGSSDELVAKLRGGSAGNYDVISPSSDVATSIVNAGLAAPLDLSRIPSYSQLSPQLTSLTLVKAKGKVYGVPFLWGPNPLLYDTSVFSEPPQSWSVLWDPKYKGKVSVWDDLSTPYMAAQILGYDHPDPAAIYNLNDEQLEAVKQKLLELKPNLRKMWTTGGELTNLFQNHEVVLAMGWPLMTTQLRKLHFPIGETIPQEDTTGWIDHLMITAAGENKDLAAQFLEFMIQAGTQKLATDVTGYAPANPGAAAMMTVEQKKLLHLDDTDAYQKRIIFWQNVPRRARYNEMWNEVKAAQ